MRRQFKYNWIALSLAILVASSCDSDDPIPVNQEELITTVRVTFTPTGGGADVVAIVQDLDGDGGNDPVKTNPTLVANSSYNVSVEFLNESVSPAENITEEVEEEAEDHQVFFEVGSGLNFTYTYGDTDANNKPIGLIGSVITGDASSGSLTLILIHEPVKSANGVDQGDPTNAGGEEDVRVTFTVIVQ